jgi:H+/gluconate symporter-like permease
MFMAYRGFSVILFAPVAALGAVLFTDPGNLLPVYSGLFQEKMVIFAKLYFPAFMLGAIFGKLVEISGYARSISAAIVRICGRDQVVYAIALIGLVLTYGGVSMFVTVFAVYPFAAEMYRQSDIPKRLIPAAIVVGAFTISMDSLPGSPQIQSIIPTAFFHTTTLAAPTLGLIGSIFTGGICFWYLMLRVRQARAAGEGYGKGHINEPEVAADLELTHPLIAASPLLVVFLLNAAFTLWIVPAVFGTTSTVVLNPGDPPIVQDVSKLNGIWSLNAALVIGIIYLCIIGHKTVLPKFAEATKTAVGGSLLAIMNTSSEFGFGSVISALPGFTLIKSALNVIPYAPLNEAVTINVLAGVTGSASGGMSIALGALGDQFIAAANAAHVPLDVMSRIASMASGGMDTLPHNGAIITLLAITGLTHRQSYKDIFVITVTKTVGAFFTVLVYYLTGLV